MNHQGGGQRDWKDFKEKKAEDDHWFNHQTMRKPQRKKETELYGKAFRDTL